MYRESLELTAPTVEEAKQSAMETMGVEDPTEVEVVVLDEGSGSGFTFQRKPARVRVVRTHPEFGHVSRELPESIPELPPEDSADSVRLVRGVSAGSSRRRAMPKPSLVIEEAAPQPSVAKMGIEPSRARERDEYEPTDEDNALVTEVVEDLLNATDLDYELEIEHADYQRVFINLPDQQAGALIGRRGANIDALEHVLTRMVNQRAGRAIPLQVDVNDYRQREEEKLEELARHLAKEATDSGEEIHLEPMNPRDRRVVHLAIQELGTLTTYTIGEGPRRHVVIVPGEADATS